MDSVYLDYYHPYAGLCNQLYLITNHIHESFQKKTKIYIHKINIDIFKKCRVPAGDVLDLVKTGNRLRLLLGYDIIDLVKPKSISNIPRLCIYPVSSIEILNCLEFNQSILNKVSGISEYYGIHFRLEIDVIIHYLFGEYCYSNFMDSKDIDTDKLLRIPEVLEYIQVLMEQYFRYISIF